MALARNEDNTLKASLRVGGTNGNAKDIDLRSLVSKIVQISGGEAGGHLQAAGAHIPSENETAFISAAHNVLKQAVMEEIVQ